MQRISALFSQARRGAVRFEVDRVHCPEIYLNSTRREGIITVSVAALSAASVADIRSNPPARL